MSTGGPQALALWVRRRRVELGFTQSSWPENARLSRALLRKIESGRYDRYEADTFIKIELDLGWAPGSVDAILAGGRPTVEDDPPADSPVHRTA